MCGCVSMYSLFVFLICWGCLAQCRDALCFVLFPLFACLCCLFAVCFVVCSFALVSHYLHVCLTVRYVYLLVPCIICRFLFLCWDCLAHCFVLFYFCFVSSFLCCLVAVCFVVRRICLVSDSIFPLGCLVRSSWLLPGCQLVASYD